LIPYYVANIIYYNISSQKISAYYYKIFFYAVLKLFFYERMTNVI